MRDDVVGVVHLPVDREGGEEDPREAADREDADEAERVQHRRVEVDVPAPERRQPVEDLHPVGTAITIEATMKNAFRKPASRP